MTKEFDATELERGEAYRKAQEAKARLDAAAQALGYPDVTKLSLEAPEMDLSQEEKDGIKAITNSHSYLDNGMLEGLLETDC